jgi:hypothetical protein
VAVGCRSRRIGVVLEEAVPALGTVRLASDEVDRLIGGGEADRRFVGLLWRTELKRRIRGAQRTWCRRAIGRGICVQHPCGRQSVAKMALRGPFRIRMIQKLVWLQDDDEHSERDDRRRDNEAAGKNHPDMIDPWCEISVPSARS